MASYAETMRRNIAIAVLIIVAASFSPWLRRQEFFSPFIGLTVLVGVALAIYGALRKLDSVSERTDSSKTAWWRTKRSKYLFIAIIISTIAPISHFIVTNS